MIDNSLPEKKVSVKLSTESYLTALVSLPSGQPRQPPHEKPTSSYYLRGVPQRAGHAKHVPRRRFPPALGPLLEQQSLYRFNRFERNRNFRGVGADSEALRTYRGVPVREWAFSHLARAEQPHVIRT